MNIKKSNSYIVGSSRLTPIIGKERKLLFDMGEEIGVTEFEYDKISSHGWCELVEEENVSET